MGFSASQLASASLIGQIGGAVTSSIGSYYGAATQKAAFKGQAALADTNARIQFTDETFKYPSKSI